MLQSTAHSLLTRLLSYEGDFTFLRIQGDTAEFGTYDVLKAFARYLGYTVVSEPIFGELRKDSGHIYYAGQLICMLIDKKIEELNPMLFH